MNPLFPCWEAKRGYWNLPIISLTLENDHRHIYCLCSGVPIFSSFLSCNPNGGTYLIQVACPVFVNLRSRAGSDSRVVPTLRCARCVTVMPCIPLLTRVLMPRQSFYNNGRLSRHPTQLLIAYSFSSSHSKALVTDNHVKHFSTTK
jgi:hypothetical protein